MSSSQWITSLNDFSIQDKDVVDSFKFATGKVLHPKYHDKKLWLLYRKTHFNNQISKYNQDVKPFCTWCLKTLNIETNEDLHHATFACPKILNLPDRLLETLNIEHLSSKPHTDKKINLGDSDCIPGAKLLMDTIWLLYTCLILTSRLNETPININNIAQKIIFEIKTTNKCYPSRDLGKCTRLLNLEQFRLFLFGATKLTPYLYNPNDNGIQTYTTPMTTVSTNTY